MRRALGLALLVAAAPALAQQDDRSYLTAFLEDNLSDAGRAVTITGFSGALSSQASIESLTIADDQGVWITLNGIVLDWSRSSLLSGQFVVNELSAKEIIVARAPDTGDSGLPDPEAAGFSLPELPVSVEIGRVAADRIVLEPALFGQAVEGSLEASLSLVAGEGKASFALLRSDDGPEGQITLDASYSNLGRQLDLALRAIEGKGGLAATLLGLPGTPAAELSVIGSGPFEDFGADLQLSTDGVSRLAGRVTLMSDPVAGSRFNASLAGDPAPLFLPDYAEFFGSDVALTIAGSRSPEGRLALDDLSVTTQALTLDGKAVVAADGSPETVVLTGTLALADGAPVLLPFGEVETRVSSATIGIDYDRATGPDWRGAFVMLGLDRADFKAARLTIDGSGSIAKLGTAQTVDAVIGFAATGLQATDPDLATAIGDAVDGSITAQWREGSGA